MPDDVISLRQYVDSRFDAQDRAVATAMSAAEKAVAAALMAAEKAVVKQENATEKRFENTNEWRNTVETLQRTYMPRTEFEQATRTYAEKLEGLQKLFYIGVGVVLAFQFLIGVAVIVWQKGK